MRTLLAALALIALASTATPALADCNSSACAVQQPDTPALPQTPEGCDSCALPTPPAQKLAECINCAVEQPDTPAIPQKPEDCTSPNCAIPMPVQKLLRDQLRQQWLLGSLIRH
jgi:hypothetical protein